MAIEEKYLMLRKTGRGLNAKIMNSALEKEAIELAGRLLGIARRNLFTFESQDEMSVLMDFAINECHNRNNGKNALQLYNERVGLQNEKEKQVISAMLKSYTSLLKVKEVRPEESTIIVDDILNRVEGMRLVDLGLSMSAVSGLLLFTRLVPFQGFRITGGFGLSFEGRMEGFLLRRYPVLARKVKADGEAARRYVAFFKLSKTYGKEVMLA